MRMPLRFYPSKYRIFKQLPLLRFRVIFLNEKKNVKISETCFLEMSSNLCLQNSRCDLISLNTFLAHQKNFQMPTYLLSPDVNPNSKLGYID